MAITLTLPKNIKGRQQEFLNYMNLMKLTDKTLTTVNQQSLVNALATIWDLELTNTQVRKEIALIPYGQELQVQIQEDGFLKLLKDNITVIDFQREIITDKHIFNDKNQRWEINPAKIFEPKKVIGFYGSITIKNSLGNTINFYKGMTVAECTEWKNKFSKSANGPWVKSFNQMSLKTVIKAIIRDIFKDPTITMKNKVIMDKAMQLDQAVVIDSETINYADNPNNNGENIKLQPINEQETINIQEQETDVQNTITNVQNEPTAPQDIILNHFSYRNVQAEKSLQEINNPTISVQPFNGFNFEEEQDKIDRLDLGDDE